MIAAGSCSAIPRRHASRASRASTKSVSAIVRTRGAGRAAASSTVAPARAIDATSSSTAARQPVVAPTDDDEDVGAGHALGARRAGRRPEWPLSSNRFERKPGVRTSRIGCSGDVRST